MILRKASPGWIAALLAFLLLAGCGNSTQSTPEAADPSGAPESAAPAPSSAAPAPAESAPSQAPESSSLVPDQSSEPEQPAPDPAEMLTIETGDSGTTYTFHQLPQNAEEMEGLWELQQSAPEHTAALCVAAFCRYPQSKEDCIAMLEILRGPNPMAEKDIQFISDRFREKDYVPRSYFAGAAPDNDYTPDEPWTLTVTSDSHSYDQENLARLYITSGGADSPRSVTLRKAKDGNWYLWEYSSVLLGIRLPGSEDPWA